jgi:two-component system, LuxR family, response regulator FixJ
MMTSVSVYIVDDDEAIRESLQLLLEGRGHHVFTYPSAEDFLATCRPGMAGCAIVDLRMPGMDGLALTEQLKRKGINLPVIMVTGHGDVPLAVKAMRAGAVDFVEKPYSTDTILDAIRRASDLAGRAQLDDVVPEKVAVLLASLTPRERDVLDQLVLGNPNKIIAHELNISPRTVEIHRANLMKKMQADSLSHLVRMALAAGTGSAGR